MATRPNDLVVTISQKRPRAVCQWDIGHSGLTPTTRFVRCRKEVELNSWPGRSMARADKPRRSATAMIDKRISQFETDVRVLTSLIAQLETKAQAQTTKIQDLQAAMRGLAREIADLRTRVEEIRHVSSSVHALS
jgi:predicted RNase H-like nuclease (RuvC/YqgF family)